MCGCGLRHGHGDGEGAAAAFGLGVSESATQDGATLQQGRQQRTEGSRQALLAALPDAFNRTTYLQAAERMGIGEKTAERYIAELCKTGMLEHPANGQYRKTS